MRGITSLILGYLRWTQLIPMMLSLTAVLCILAVMIFGRFAISIEDLPAEQRADFLSSVYVQTVLESTVQSVQWVIERFRDASGEVQIDRLILAVWSVAGLVALLFGLILRALGFKPKNRTLGEKIRWFGLACLVPALMCSALLISFETYRDGALVAILWGFSLAVFPFLLGCWGLWVSHLIWHLEVSMGLVSAPEKPGASIPPAR